MAKVMCRCQALYFRTWYLSSPVSFLLEPKHSSIGQRCTGDIDEFAESGAVRVVAVVEREFTVVDGAADHVLVVGFGRFR